jgi:hypothetical protein
LTPATGKSMSQDRLESCSSLDAKNPMEGFTIDESHLP